MVVPMLKANSLQVKALETLLWTSPFNSAARVHDFQAPTRAPND
jgi:hypothetical protein